jgi:hypothetical protein
MSDQVKNIMLNMYPKRKVPLPSNPEDEEDIQITQEQPFIHPENRKNKITDKWMFSAIIAAVCVFLFSSFFLDFVDDICMKRDTSAFNSKGEPKLHLIAVIFTIILLLTRTFFSLV